MKRLLVVCALSLLAPLGIANTLTAADTPAAAVPDRAWGYLKYLPADINVLSIVRIEDIMKTPRAIRDDWQGKHEAEFMAGSARIPPWVQLLVRGERFDHPGEAPIMTASVVPEPEDVPFDKLFPRDKPAMDEIAGVKVLRAPRGMLAEIAPGVLGAMAPPSRSAFGAWLRTVQTDSSVRIPKYLANVATSYRPQILLAADLQDLMDPTAMCHRVGVCPVISQDPAGQAALKNLLPKLKGVRIGVNVQDDIFCAIAFDFDATPGPEAKYLRALLNEALDDAGAHIDEVETADVKILPTSVELSGKISEMTLRRLMTLIVTPVSLQKENYTPMQAKAAPTTAELTQKYFSMVNNTVRDLQILNHRAKSYSKTAQWHDNYANKIAGFPTAGVDPMVVKYGQYIVEGLRALAQSLRGVGIHLDNLEGDISYSIHVSPIYGPAGTYTAWGYNPRPWEVSDNLDDVRKQQDAAIQQGMDDRDKIWTAMGNERDSVQGHMSQKFHMDFKL